MEDLHVLQMKRSLSVLNESKESCLSWVIGMRDIRIKIPDRLELESPACDIGKLNTTIKTDYQPPERAFCVTLCG